MASSWHFVVFVAVSFLAFIAVIRVALGRRNRLPASARIVWVAVAVVVGGMLFAKAAASIGWPWWIYYGAPAALTWCLPPVVFHMRSVEVAKYIPMAILTAPAIHAVFSFFLGWKEYMPFVPLPAAWELLH